MGRNNTGSPLALSIDKDLTAQELRIVELLAVATPEEVIAEETGLNLDRVRAYMRSGKVLAALAGRSLTTIHSVLVPLGLDVITGLLSGYVTSVNIDARGKRRIVRTEVQVPPAVRLAAAQTVLKLARLEEHAPPDAADDLSTATPERLRELVGVLEDRLASLAADVTPQSAPRPADVATDNPYESEGYSVLDD